MIYANIKKVDLNFETEATIFSPNFIDTGTLAMLSIIDFFRVIKCWIGAAVMVWLAYLQENL